MQIFASFSSNFMTMTAETVMLDNSSKYFSGLFKKYSRHIHLRHVYVVLIMVTPRTPLIDDQIIFQNVFRFFWHEDFRDDLEAFLDSKSLSNVSICKRKNKLNYCPKILCWVHSHLAEALFLHFLSVTILTNFQQRIRVCGFF